MVHRQAWTCAKPTELKTFVHQDFYGIHLGTIVGLSNLHISKTTNFNFSQNSPPSHLSSYVVVHRPTWPCAESTELKTFVHQHFYGIHLGAFGGQSNPHISKTTNFNFSQNSPPSHLAMPSCTAKLGHVENPPNSKLSCTKTFMVFIWGHLEAFPTIRSQKPQKFNFSQNSPPSHLAMPWCTAKLGHVQNPPNSKLSCTKTFMVFIWRHLEAFPTITSQKPRISFFHKTPHQAI